MSSLARHAVTALGGLIAGLTLSAIPIWRLHRALTASRRALQRAVHDATHDEVTGLANRRLFLARLAAALQAGASVGVVLADLDHFKNVNDTLGHEAGNDLLCAIGTRLCGRPHPVVLAARLSGDEFVLLVNGDSATVATAARAVWHAIADAPQPVDGGQIAVRASVGYACAHPGVRPRALLHQADLAMYEAKRRRCGVAAAAPGGRSTAGVRRPRPRDLRFDSRTP